MTWGQAVIPDGKEKDYPSKAQGEVLNFVLQRKDVSKVPVSQKQNKQAKTTCSFSHTDKTDSSWKNTRTGQCIYSIRLRKADSPWQELR